jgi:hypothetical protein
MGLALGDFSGRNSVKSLQLTLRHYSIQKAWKAVILGGGDTKKPLTHVPLSFNYLSFIHYASYYMTFKGFGGHDPYESQWQHEATQESQVGESPMNVIYKLSISFFKLPSPRACWGFCLMCLQQQPRRACYCFSQPGRSKVLPIDGSCHLLLV